MQKVIVRYNFAGALLFPSEPQQNVDLQGIVTLSGPVSGFFEFDASTSPASPGKFNLNTAKFQGDFGGLHVHATGGQATVQGANDSTLALTFPLGASLFPVPIVTAQASFSFVTFLDFYFSRFFLPAREINDGDRTTAVTFTDKNGQHGNLSTDTNVHFTSFHVTVV
jgi:hypothetical protein